MSSIIWSLPETGNPTKLNTICSMSHIKKQKEMMLSNSNNHSIKLWSTDKPEIKASVPSDKNYSVKASIRSSGKLLSTVLKEDSFSWELETNTKWLLLPIKLSINHQSASECKNFKKQSRVWINLASSWRAARNSEINLR